MNYYKNHPKSEAGGICIVVPQACWQSGHDIGLNTVEDVIYSWKSAQEWTLYRGIVHTLRSRIH